MSYSPVGKSKNKMSNNDVIRYNIKNLIDKEYRRAIQSGDWSNYDFVDNAYYNYKLNGGNSYYIKSIVKNYQIQYERQQSQKEIDKVQYDCILDMINVMLNDTKEVETVHTEASGEKFIDFNERVYDTYMSPMIKTIEVTKPDCYSIAETNPKSSDEMSYEEKIKFVNKQIDDLLDFVERNKQAKYDKWRKEISI